MDKLVSSWCSDKTLPESYIFPPDTRPGNLADAPVSASVPTIDLSGDRPDTIHKIIEASRDFGFFQVTNHGIDGKLVAESGDVLKEVFQMTAEDKAALNTFSGDKKRSPSSSSSFKLYTSTTNYDKEQLHFWRDNFKHPCFPNLQHCIKSWPEKPSRYREIIKEYCVEAKKLGSRILELISEGLGLGNEYFNGSLSEVAHLSVNHYPPCPDPSLTLGLARHCDPGLITILHQDVYGLQVFKDGEWIGVDPLPHAFVINIGYQLQVFNTLNCSSPKFNNITFCFLDYLTKIVYMFFNQENIYFTSKLSYYFHFSY